MNANQFSAALDRLDLTLAAAAAFFDVSFTTARRWADGVYPVPRSVEILLCLMISNDWQPWELTDAKEREGVLASL